ncbi:MAG: hypothetical protein ACFCU3_07040 [Verrucomicrobiales bacterium]
MKSLWFSFNLIILLSWLPSLAAAEIKIKLDLEGNGQSRELVVRALGNETFAVQGLDQELRLAEFDQDFFHNDPPELKAVTPFPGRSTQWLQFTLIGSSDYNEHVFISLNNGRLEIVGRLRGQGGIRVPGNGSIIQEVWMGFWTRIIKHQIHPDGVLREIEAEFAAVGVTGKVTKSFEILARRDSTEILGIPQLNSEVEVILWAPGTAARNDWERNDWYLIHTSTGLTGWIDLETLAGESVVELPWAG